MELLRRYVRALIQEKFTCAPLGAEADEADAGRETEDLLIEPDENEDREEAATDEFSGAGAIAGYTLPLGASNHPTTLKQRGDIAGSGFGGAKPYRTKKRKKKSSDS